MFSVIVALLCVFGVQAQVEVFNANVSEAGQLESVIGDKWDSIDSLVVTGPVNATDFKTMWNCAFNGKMTVLNLEKAQVENNKIPDYALCDMNAQYWDAPGIIYLKIRRVILPDNIEEIGKCAFNYTKLEEINIPSTVRKFGIYSFANCWYLKIDPLVIPEGVEQIPGQCFASCRSLNKVVLPSSLRIISEVAFSGAGISEIEFSEGLDSIGNYAFEGLYNLRKAILPSSCRRFGSGIFTSCINLEEIYIPEGWECIPNSFAYSCIGLKSIDIPKSVTTVCNGAFEGCVGLKEIKLHEGLESLEDKAFAYCSPDSIVFPASLKYMGEDCCDGWTSIKKIYSLASFPPFVAGKMINENSANDCSLGSNIPSDLPVYVPVGSAELYRSAEGWSYFTNIIELENFPSSGIEPVLGVRTVKSRAFRSGDDIVIGADVAGEKQQYAIYSLDGRLVAKGVVDDGTVNVSLPKGMYIVKIGQDTHKVM